MQKKMARKEEEIYCSGDEWMKREEKELSGNKVKYVSETDFKKCISWKVLKRRPVLMS